jgi:predicted metal-dependent enzyme (double-stranded beta helix superfamily)
MTHAERFRRFVRDFTLLVDRARDDEPRILDTGAELLRGLLGRDDWLPSEFARADAAGYRQYLLHCDPLERFSVVSFVWGPDQRTPVHDHTVWGMIGVLRGRERCREYSRAGGGAPMAMTGEHLLEPGEIDLVSPALGDIHEVANALPDAASVSIHVYGGNIGTIRRHVYDAASGAASPFVSGYSNPVLPNGWAESSP